MMIPIVFTIDKAFLPPAYVSIASLINNASENTVYDIIILYQGKLNQKVYLLCDVVKGSRHRIQIQSIADIKMNVPKTTKFWPSVVYARLYLPSILIGYDKIIFSDVDVLFLGDLTEVFCTDMEGFEWGGVAAELNSPAVVIHQYYLENKHSYIYWSGFMLMNLKEMRYKNWEERCNSNIEKYKERLYMCDLEILNLTAKNIKRLPFRYVCLQAIYDSPNIDQTEEYSWLSKVYTYEELENEKKNAVIIHYAGTVGKIGKIWLRLKIPEYYANYLKKMPYQFKWQNNKARIWKNVKVLVKTILEIIRVIK